MELSKGWEKYLLNLLGKSTFWICKKGNIENFDVFKEFLLEVKNIVFMDEIPKDLIINVDQTGTNYVPLTSYTMEQEGARCLEILAKDALITDFCHHSLCIMRGTFLNFIFLQIGTSHFCQIIGPMNLL